jgi:hypothetical protein
LHSGLKSFHGSPSLGASTQEPRHPAHNEEDCHSYTTNFFEAVTARQAASFCKDGIDRVRILELIDSEIDAFNDLIATLCSR